MVTWPFVREMLVFEELESTSNNARAMLQHGAHALPFAVWAKHQTLGRGQRHNLWWSDKGSLTFTLALDAAAHGLRVEQEPRLALMTAVAVIEAIEQRGLSAPGIGIRWPNDVEIGDRKLGGILPERVEVGKEHRLLIGVGLNVLTQFDQAPSAVGRLATSLSAFQSEPLESSILPQLLSAILTRFEFNLYRLAEDDLGLAQEWDRLNLLRHQAIRVALGSRIVAGKVFAIDPQGALCLHDGVREHRLYGGQVLRDQRAWLPSASSAERKGP
jgi:BirA family transcriptional regulator, biotin operon repressor / biotin---[acetyl-CoA-carboxylase] ligase